MPPSTRILEDKKAILEEMIRNRKSVLVAYSGGVDSALLAAIARKVLGDHATCILLVSPVVPRSAIDEAEKIAREIGVRCDLVPVPLLACEEFIRNPEDRCYHCRKVSAAVLRDYSARNGLGSIVDGLNISDYRQYRPGIRASDEEGIGHPFVEAGISKDEIREIAKASGFSFWDKPSDSCLSTRIEYGEEITTWKLAMIQESEEFLKSKGFRQVRVRLHCGALARVEVDPDLMGRAVAAREEITGELRRLGLIFVTLDLEGFRSGSMDEARSRGPGRDAGSR